jgi:hypothetical protein
MVCKAIHRKPKIEHHEAGIEHMCSGSVDLPAPLVTPVVLKQVTCHERGKDGI